MLLVMSGVLSGSRVRTGNRTSSAKHCRSQNKAVVDCRQNGERTEKCKEFLFFMIDRKLKICTELHDYDGSTIWIKSTDLHTYTYQWQELMQARSLGVHKHVVRTYVHRITYVHFKPRE